MHLDASFFAWIKKESLIVPDDLISSEGLRQSLYRDDGIWPSVGKPIEAPVQAPYCLRLSGYVVHGFVRHGSPFPNAAQKESLAPVSGPPRKSPCIMDFGTLFHTGSYALYSTRLPRGSGATIALSLAKLRIRRGMT
jgi:hypothetical protein